MDNCNLDEFRKPQQLRQPAVEAALIYGLYLFHQGASTDCEKLSLGTMHAHCSPGRAQGCK